MHDASIALSSFLDAVAAKQPAPGGGSVAAVAGALAAAMGEMVLNYSVGKKDLADHRPMLEDALAQLTRARGLLLRLMTEDQAAFESLTAAKKAGDPATLGAAVLTAIRVPQAIAATAAAILEQAERVAPIANRWLLSDLAVSAELAMATVRCGTYNVRVNLGDVAEPAERKKLAGWCDDLVARGAAAMRRAMPAIWARIDAA